MADIKDIALTIAANVTGQEQINALAEQLLLLAKDGGEAAPQFATLAAELNKLGEQSATVTALGALEKQTLSTANQLFQARQAASDLGATLAEQRAIVQTLAQSQASATEAYASQSTAIREQQKALLDLRVANDAEDRQTQAYKEQVDALRTTLAGLRSTQLDNKSAVESSTASLKDAEGILKSVSVAYDAVLTPIVGLQQQLNSQNAALSEARVAMTQAGVAATDFATGQGAVSKALADTVTRTQEAVRAQQDYEARLAEQAALESAVAESNLRSVDSARAAAQARVDALSQEVAAQREQQAQVEAASLAEKLAAESLSSAIAASNAKNVELAKTAAQAREDAAKQAAAVEVAAQKEIDAATYKSRLEVEQIVLAKLEEAKVFEATAAREAQALQDAFGVVGVRSAQSIENELAKVRQAMTTIATSSELTGAQIDSALLAGQSRVQSLEAELKKANGQLASTGGVLESLKGTMGQFAAGNLIANVVMGLVAQVQQLGTEAFNANKQLETMRLGLTSVYGSSQVAASQIEFLRKTANAAGVSIGDISGEFIKYAASAQAANIPLRTTNGLFAAITMQSAALGLSGAKVGDMLNALGQMASKGTVQMEELRGQLGDALPGALPKTAAGLGITTAEMEAMAKRGELLASEVFPALQKALSENVGEVNTMSAIWERFKNSATETAQAIGDTGAWTGLKVALMAVGEAFSLLGLGASVAFDTIITGFRSAGAAAVALAHGDIKGAVDTMNTLWDDYLKRNTERATKFQELDAQNVKSFEKLASGAENAGAKATAAADQYVWASDKFVLVGAATEKTADQIAKTEVTWTLLNNAYGKVQVSLEKQIAVSNAVVAAKAAEGATLEEIAKISGNQIQIAQASALASDANARAHETLTSNLRVELGVLKSKLDADLALVGAAGKSNDAQRAQIEALQQSIKVKTEELTKSEESTEKLKLESEARKLAVVALADNSKQVDTLRQAYQVLSEQVSILREMQLQGLPVEQQLKDAMLEQAKAANLLAAATQQKITVINSENTLKQTQLKLSETTLMLAKTEAQAELDLANAKGRTDLARRATITLKELEADMAALVAKGLRLEAQASLEAADAKYQAIQASRTLTQAEQNEWDAVRVNAEIKQKQAQISDTTAESLRNLTIEMLKSGDAATQSSGGVGNLSDSLSRAADQALRLGTNLNNVPTGVGGAGGGGLNPDGTMIPSPIDRRGGTATLTQLAVLQQKQNAGMLQASDLQGAQSAYMENYNNFKSMQAIASADAGAISLDTLSSFQKAMLDSKTILDQVQKMQQVTTSTANTSTSNTSTASGVATTININLTTPAGTTQTVLNNISAADQTKLVDMLKQIELDMKRAA